MKSVRRVKDKEQNLGPKANSLPSVRPANEDQGDDWLQTKVLLKPQNQLTLTDAQLAEEFTRILNANNPLAPQNLARFNHKDKAYKATPSVEHHATHFEFEGYWAFKSDDAQDDLRAIANNAAGSAYNSQTQLADLAAEPVEGQTQAAPIKDRFNFSQRATQTVDNSHRQRSTNTEPPPQRTFSENLNQWIIFDAYTEDALQKEKGSKEKQKTATSGKNNKDQKNATLPPVEGHTDEGIHKSSELKKVLTIVERMANQNTFDDICQDFKYWEDNSDALPSRKAEGTLLPLWKFSLEKNKLKHVTAICWNPANADLFAVGYGSYDFSKQGPGIVACFSLKNPSYPEYLYLTESGVLCLDFHPQHPSLIAAGLYDGNVAVFDLQNKNAVPTFKSDAKSGKHGDPVWQVSWQKDNLDENLNFASVSSDGCVRQWVLLTNELVYTDLIKLVSPTAAIEEPEKNLNLAGAYCIDFHKKQEDIFVVGTEEGSIFACSKQYNSQALLSFEGHDISVYAVRFNKFNTNVFLSASADWTIKLWDKDQKKHLLMFDLGGPVGDVAWAPYSATVFAAVTQDGKVCVYDLSMNKYKPTCEQQIVKKAKLTHLAFSPSQPILLVGDDHGHVACLKLSPNLRKSGDSADDQSSRLAEVLKIGTVDLF